MQVSITGHHLAMTDPLKNYVKEKLHRVERHFDNISQAHVVLSVEKMRQIAEAKLHVQGGEVFANSESEDMYAAIDGLIDKLDRQVIKHKEKKAKH